VAERNFGDFEVGRSGYMSVVQTRRRGDDAAMPQPSGARRGFAAEHGAATFFYIARLV